MRREDLWMYEYALFSLLFQNHSIKIRMSPRPLDGGAGCLPMGTIGLAVNGVALFNPYTALGQNAVTGEHQEIFDECEGHPQMQGTYHYHQISSCVHNYLFNNSVEIEKLFGVALDGYPIYVTRDGTQTGLDACNGKTVNGGYRYYATYEFPYLLGCFKGEVIDENLINGPGYGNMPPPNGNMPPPNGNRPPPGGNMPPPNGNRPPPGGNMPPPGGQMGGHCFHANQEFPDGFEDLTAGTINEVSDAVRGADSDAVCSASAATMLIMLLVMAVQILF